MTSDDILPTLSRLGLAINPALRGTTFVLEPIPCFNGCPLGLYDSQTNTIILPPEFSPEALIHEVGHRFGHYFSNDLSETYAERFRKRYSSGIDSGIAYFLGSLCYRCT